MRALCAGVRVSGSVGMCMRIGACSLAYPACNVYAPYSDVTCGPLDPPYFSTLSLKGMIFGGKSF